MKAIYNMFASLIILKKMTFDKIAEIFKAGVREALIEKGHPELASPSEAEEN